MTEDTAYPIVKGAVEFPSSSSTLYDGHGDQQLGKGGGGAVSTAGTHVEQQFAGTKVPLIKSITYDFSMDDQTTSSCAVGDLHFDITVNGEKLGQYMFAGGTSSSPVGTIGLDGHIDLKCPIAGTGSGGDTYTIRYEALETVCSGGGSYNWWPGGSFVMNP